MSAISANDTALPAYDPQDDLITLQALSQGAELLFAQVVYENTAASNALWALFTVLTDHFEAAIQRSNCHARVRRAQA